MCPSNALDRGHSDTCLENGHLCARLEGQRKEKREGDRGKLILWLILWVLWATALGTSPNL